MAKNGKVERKEQVHILLSKREKAVLEAYALRTERSVTACIRLLLAANIEGFADSHKLLAPRKVKRG
jgi:hypothetical protein